jgi:hypothetical protein
MSSKARIRLAFSVLTLTFASTVTWLVTGETSPFKEYFLWHVGIPNAWGMLNLLPAIISAMAAGNIHAGNAAVFYIAFAIQWLGIGWLLSFPFTRNSG